MYEGLFQNITEAEKDEAIKKIIQHATPRQDFFMMLALSVSMATFGILLNNTIILIGSMLVAPLIFPIVSLALGVIVADNGLMGRSIYTLIKSIIIALIAGVVIGLLFSDRGVPDILLSMTKPSSLMYIIVAAIAGFAAAFAMTKPHLNETLPGVAISVALVPPLAAAGVALSLFNLSMFSSAMLLFFVNIIGIVFSAMIVFALLHFSVKKTVAVKEVKKEEKVVEKEEKKVD